jgi:hypothetical protein
MIFNGSNGFHFDLGNIKDLKETITKFDMLSDSEKNKRDLVLLREIHQNIRQSCKWII